MKNITRWTYSNEKSNFELTDPKKEFKYAVPDIKKNNDLALTSKAPANKANIEKNTDFSEVLDDPIYEDVCAWVMEFIIENQYQANTAHLGKLLIRCYKSVLNHKTNNPSLTKAELRQFLETILFASMSLQDTK